MTLRISESGILCVSPSSGSLCLCPGVAGICFACRGTDPSIFNVTVSGVVDDDDVQPLDVEINDTVEASRASLAFCTWSVGKGGFFISQGTKSWGVRFSSDTNTPLEQFDLPVGLKIVGTISAFTQFSGLRARAAWYTLLSTDPDARVSCLSIATGPLANFIYHEGGWDASNAAFSINSIEAE